MKWSSTYGEMLGFGRLLISLGAAILAIVFLDDVPLIISGVILIILGVVPIVVGLRGRKKGRL